MNVVLILPVKTRSFYPVTEALFPSGSCLLKPANFLFSFGDYFWCGYGVAIFVDTYKCKICTVCMCPVTRIKRFGVDFYPHFKRSIKYSVYRCLKCNHFPEFDWVVKINFINRCRYADCLSMFRGAKGGTNVDPKHQLPAQKM